MARPTDPVLAEILAAAGMPKTGVRVWMRNLRKFCNRHGGERYYAELLEFIDACQDELQDDRDR